MSDPRRWVEEDADAAPHERALLQAGLDMDPPAGAEDAIWAALSAKIGPGGGGGDGGDGGDGGGGDDGGSGGGPSGDMGIPMGAFAQAATAISSAVGGALGVVGSAKGLVVGLLSTAIVAGAVATVVPAKQAPPGAPKVEPTAAAEIAAPPVTAKPNVPPPEAAPAHPPPVENEAPKSAPPPRLSPPANASPTELPDPLPSVNPEVARAKRESQLREEKTALGDARAALRGGDTASALQKLEAVGGRFPNGTLAQEREALAIEALARAGQSAAASERAAAFLRAYPTSPHAMKIRGFVR